MRALVLGGAEGMQADAVGAALAGYDADVIIAVNHAARDWPGQVDHFATFHAELLPMWTKARAAAGRPPALRYWTGVRRPIPEGITKLERVSNWGGSSGLLAVTVALEGLGCTHALLCGVPMTMTPHYDDPKPWGDAGNYLANWQRHVDVMAGRVRSMSGWTRQLLGGPDRSWIHVEEEPRRP